MSTVTDAAGRTPDCAEDLKDVLDPARYAEGTVLDLAGPLADGEIVLDEVVPARAPWSAVVKQGDVLTIVDVGANQSGDCLLYNAHDTSERYSVPDTIAWGGNVYVRTGTVLRSNEGNPLATVIANEIDRQDTIGGACGKESNTLRYGHHTASEHGCRENFLAEASKYGMGARDLVSNLNWFMNVPIEADGTLGIVDGISAPGKRVAFRAETDILVLVSNCPQVNNPCNDFNPTPLRMIVTAGKRCERTAGLGVRHRPGRQPRRDRPPRHAHRPRARAADGGGLLGGGPGRPARPRGR